MTAFDALYRRCVNLQEKVFVGGTALSAAHHLRDEADKLISALEQDNLSDVAAEIADVFILLAVVASRSRIDILHVAAEKMDINEQREWGMPDERGVVHHVIAQGD